MDLNLSDINKLAFDLGKAGVKAVPLAAAVVKKTAYDVERDAKTFAPVDTGALRNSISTDLFDLSSITSISAEIGPTVEYGLYVEEGTSTQGPAAYMGPALDRHAAIFEQALGQIVDGIL